MMSYENESFSQIQTSFESLLALWFYVAAVIAERIRRFRCNAKLFVQSIVFALNTLPVAIHHSIIWFPSTSSNIIQSKRELSFPTLCKPLQLRQLVSLHSRTGSMSINCTQDAEKNKI
ncbi:hypothetical protein BD560DRAFT_487008 [Blakeslea trispora]|nr:hypothetical protein BD560DRAFT_487008 [Blakeslea trispora]